MYAPTTRFGKRWITKLEPWRTDDLGRFVDAVGQMFEAVLELTEEEGMIGKPGWVPSWGKLFNPELCPAPYLGYLAQYVGVELPKEATEAEKRALIKAESGLERGTLKAVESAVERTLGVGVPFHIVERTELSGGSNPYWFLIFVPIGKGSQALREAVERTKPGGVLFSVVELSGAWVGGAKRWSEVAAGKTWATVKEGEY